MRLVVILDCVNSHFYFLPMKSAFSSFPFTKSYSKYSFIPISYAKKPPAVTINKSQRMITDICPSSQHARIGRIVG